MGHKGDDEYLRGDLENIDEEMRMGRIRQAASKHTWAHFNDVFYKNLMDRRLRLDASDKEDWHNAIQFLKKNMPCDDGRETAAQLRFLAEHLGLRSPQIALEVYTKDAAVVSSSIGCFGAHPKDSPRLTALIDKQRWGTILSSLNAMRGFLPPTLSREEKEYCLRSLEILERDLLDTSASSLPIVDRINRGVLGLCQPRTEFSPFTIHLIADPKAFFDPKAPELFSINEEALLEGVLVPCARLCVASSSDSNLFPDRSFLGLQGEWVSSNTGRSLPAAFCLRFARPIIFCAAALKKLSELCTGELKVEGGLNIYRYFMNDEEDERSEIFAKLPGCVVQRYELDDCMLDSKEDGIIEEICFAHPRDAIAIVNIVRSQLAHNFLFESLVRAHYPTACMDGAVTIRLSTALVHNYEFVFELDRNMFVGRVEVPDMKSYFEAIGTVGILPESKYTSSILAKTWSLAMMFRGLLRRGGLTVAPPSSDEVNILHNENVDKKDDVKISQCWSSVSCNAKKSSRGTTEKMFTVLEEGGGVNGKPPTLLQIFKEVEILHELIPPIGSQNAGMKPPSVPSRPSETLVPRTAMRLQSEQTLTMNVLSDLKEICSMADAMDEPESEHSGRSSVVERRSPSTAEAQRMQSQLTPQPSSPATNERFRQQLPGLQQLSPLEIARQRLAQQTPSDVFDFDPPRINSQSQFHFPGGAQSPFPYVGVPPTRGLPGAPAKRRRGRKAANMGDRVGDQAPATLDPNSGLVASGITRRPRGTATVRRPRRPRKAAQLVASQTHTHQFPGLGDRPILQRSFSEMQYPTQSSQAAMLSSVSRVNTISGGEGLGGSSDEESTISESPQAQTPTMPSLMAPSSSSSSSQPTNSSTPVPFPSPSQFSKPTALSNSNQSSAKTSAGSTRSNTPVEASPSLAVNAPTPQPVLVTPKLEPMIPKPRKSSVLEAVVGKLHSKSSPSISLPSANPYAKSDLYDDESESPSKTECPVKLEPQVKAEPTAKPEVHHVKRESPPTPVSSASPPTRSAPGHDQPQSDLKLVFKLKQPTAPSRSATPSQYSSNIPPPTRLIGQPPSSSRSKEEKALARQKQAREKAKREAQEERNRKALKRERKHESLSTAKKAKLERPVPEPKKSVPSVTRAELPPTLAFASIKNYKIPKVAENEKSDSAQQPSSTPAYTTSTPSTSTLATTAQSSASTSGQPPMHPPKPKPIFKPPPPEGPPTPLIRPMGGMPPMLPASSGRRSLLPLPGPRTMQFPRAPMGAMRMNQQMQPAVPLLSQANSGSGRWMSLAAQKHTAKNLFAESQGSSSADRGMSDVNLSKAADSPTEGLKIADDD